MEVDVVDVDVDDDGGGCRGLCWGGAGVEVDVVLVRLV
jgi:hypothetical protein